MALKGSVTTNYWKDSSGSTRGYTLEWEATQSVSKNQSTIKWTLKTAGTYTASVSEYTLKVKLAGKTLVNKTDRVMRGSGTIKTGSFTVAHNSDGSKKITSSIKAAVYTQTVNLNVSKDWNLKEIPRKATITKVGNAKQVHEEFSGLEIEYENKAGNSASSLQVGIALQHEGQIDIPYRNISKTGSKYTFKLTDDEKDTMLLATASSNVTTIIYVLKTVIDGTTYTSTKTGTITSTSEKPTVTWNYIYDTNSKTIAITGNRNLLIQNASDCYVQATVNYTDGAVNQKTVLTCGSKKCVYDDIIQSLGTFKQVEAKKLILDVTDTRGKKYQFNKNIDLIPYVKPSCVIADVSKNAEGNAVITLQGNWVSHFKCEGFEKTNATKLVYIWDEEEIEVPLTSENMTSASTYSVSVTLTGLDYTREYKLKAKITDMLNTAETKEMVVSFTPIFNWGKDYFNFNVPVTFSKGYEASGDNKVLWTGGSYMTASQTIDLAENVSEQPNGIVLVFSAYDGKPQNLEFHSFFVPKYAVSQWEGAGHSFQMNTVGFGYVGAKYLYISDSYITGHDDNRKSGTGSGITYNNERYVLRAVLGV